MDRFNFRLETLMKLRNRHRDEMREELANAYRALDILEEQLQQVVDDQEQTEKQRAETQQVGEISADSVIEVQRFRVLLAANRTQLLEQFEQVETEVERRRQTLVEADRDVRVLEKLREKQYERFMQEQGLIENKQFDEVGAQQAIRASRAKR